MASEISKLNEELQRDKNAWESADWKTSNMVDKWWENLIGK